MRLTFRAIVAAVRGLLILALTATTVFVPALAAAQQATPRSTENAPAPLVPVAEGGASRSMLMAQQTRPAAPAAKSTGKTLDPSKELVGVMDLEAVGASKVEASSISDRLREEMLKSGRFILVDRTQMNAVMDEQAIQQSGCTSQECAVQVGKVLGVRKLVSGKVTKLTDTQWVVNATMVDVETSETVRAESLRYEGTFFNMLDKSIVELAAKLSTPPGQKTDLTAYLAAQQGTSSGGEAKPTEEKSSSSKWWWIAGGVAVLAAAAGGGSKGGAGSGGKSGCSGCGSVGYSW